MESVARRTCSRVCVPEKHTQTTDPSGCAPGASRERFRRPSARHTVGVPGTCLTETARYDAGPRFSGNDPELFWATRNFVVGVAFGWADHYRRSSSVSV